MKVFASALILKDDNILLVYHRKNKAWIQPGGKINSDESVLDGLFREIGEEVGIYSPAMLPNVDEVMIFSDYSIRSKRVISWKAIEAGLTAKYPSFMWPEQAPFAIVKNSEMVDLFYCFEVQNFDTILNMNEHKGIRWLNMLSAETVTDPLLYFLISRLINYPSWISPLTEDALSLY